MAWTGSASQVAIVNLVEYRIDAVTSGGETEAVNQQSIYEVMELVVRDIYRQADRDRGNFTGFDGTSTADGAKIDAGRSADNYLIVPAPNDFLRLLRVKTSEWLRSVDVATEITSNKYVRRFNPGSAPDIARPMCSIVSRPLAGATRALELYPLVDFDTVSVTDLYYVQEAAPESVATEFKDALIAETSARVLFSLGDFDRGAAQRQIADRLLMPLRTGLAGEEFSNLERQQAQ